MPQSTCKIGLIMLDLTKAGDKMATVKLTDAEARQLLEMIKHTLAAEVQFPVGGQTKEFDVVGDTKKDVFTINIFRGRIQPLKCYMGARIKKNGIMLLELDLNPNAVHRNPNGEKIRGSHWHIYTEKYGRLHAFPAEDIESDQFIDNTLLFLDRFNVIDKPSVTYQIELL